MTTCACNAVPDGWNVLRIDEHVPGIVSNVAGNGNFGTAVWRGGFIHLNQNDVINGGLLMPFRECLFVMSCSKDGRM